MAMRIDVETASSPYLVKDEETGVLLSAIAVRDKNGADHVITFLPFTAKFLFLFPGQPRACPGGGRRYPAGRAYSACPECGMLFRDFPDSLIVIRGNGDTILLPHRAGAFPL